MIPIPISWWSPSDLWAKSTLHFIARLKLGVEHFPLLGMRYVAGWSLQQSTMPGVTFCQIQGRLSSLDTFKLSALGRNWAHNSYICFCINSPRCAWHASHDIFRTTLGGISFLHCISSFLWKMVWETSPGSSFVPTIVHGVGFSFWIISP